MTAGIATATLAATLAVALCGCQSTQDLSAKLQKEGAKAIGSQHGLVIIARNRDARVIRTGVVSDANGTAAAIVVRNAKSTPLGETPIAIDVLDLAGKSVFRNNAPGLEPSLVSVPSLPAGAEVTWVDDQVSPSGKASAVRAELGANRTFAPPSLPQIVVGPPQLISDPVSGTEATGTIANRSSVAQVRLFVYVSAWRAGRLAAAGRGAIDRLAAGAHTAYRVYLIGNPQGAQLTVYAPPTVLR